MVSRLTILIGAVWKEANVWTGAKSAKKLFGKLFATQASLRICIQLHRNLERPRKRGERPPSRFVDICAINQLNCYSNISLRNLVKQSGFDSLILILNTQVVSIVLYNLMTNRLVKPHLKNRLRGAAHLGRDGGQS